MLVFLLFQTVNSTFWYFFTVSNIAITFMVTRVVR